MVDSRDVPSRDGLDHLFGDSAFNDILGAAPSRPTAPAPVSNGHLPSRRELRGASKSRVVVRADATSRKGSKAVKAPKAPKRKGERPAPAPAFVKPHDSAYPSTRVIVVRRGPAPIKHHRGKGFLTILAVIGLFGSVALPAYTFAPRATADGTGTNATAAPDAALLVPASAKVAPTDRGSFHATSADELKYQKRTSYIAANYAAYMASGAREQGDDYPWFSELSNNQGGGLSPLNYFYRECVDFVAWRLNRDAGSTEAPFLYTWSTLTPTGGNAYQWKYAWVHKGWPTSTTPIAGSVAWYSYNHVAYVKSVNGDGTITIEDYNQSGMHIYNKRTVPANDAQLYLYPPPR